MFEVAVTDTNTRDSLQEMPLLWFALPHPRVTESILPVKYQGPRINVLEEK